ncbi:MAG: hypothetical protein AAGG75_08510 [Bacteroidota bacterium]
MISQKYLILLTFLCSYSFLHAQNLKGKTVKQLEDFIVTADKKSRLIHIYDKKKKQLQEISLEGFSSSKSRIKSLTFVHSGLEFMEMPTDQSSSFYENETHLIFSFSEEDENGLIQQNLFFFDKRTHQVNKQRKGYRIIYGVSRRSGTFLLDSLYYTFNIFPNKAVLDIQPLYDEQSDQYLASFPYLKDQLPSPANVPILKNNSDYSLAAPISEVKFPKPKKQQKLFNKLLRQGSRGLGGATVKAEYYKEDYILITVGAQISIGDAPMMGADGTFISPSFEPQGYNYYHFQVVVDKYTLEPVSNEVLQERGVTNNKKVD